MNVFISWSGDRSKDLASALSKFLIGAFGSESPEVWMSEQDIKPGIRWAEELGQKLESSHFGVLCLTPENVNAPWLLFEAGSLAKSVSRSTVVPYRLEVRSDDIPFPLAQFRGIDADEDGTLGLLQKLNSKLENRLDQQQLRSVFNGRWPSLKSEIENITKSASFVAASKIEQERHRVRKICARIAGAWWERIPGDGLGFFQVQMDELHNSVRLGQGHFYNETGDKVADWNSVAARVTEENDKVVIVYLRECRVPERDAKAWFHGYGDMYFEGSAESFSQGDGMFFDVNRDDPQKTLGKSVQLRRVHEKEDISTMQNGTAAACEALVNKVIAEWKASNSTS